MIDTDALVTWVNAISTEIEMKFVKGPRNPEFLKADLVGTITPLEGAGLTLEAAGSLSSFQIRMQSREHQESALRKSAFQIDEALVFGDWPADVWGTRIQYVGRTGGEPAILQEDEFDRVAYVCSYVAHETPERPA